MTRPLHALMPLLATLLFAATPASAAIFVYQLPDGTRIITDHLLRGSDYRLVRSSQTAEGVGVLAAKRSYTFFRTDPQAFDKLIKRTARENEVDPALVKAVIHAESAFNPYATSHKGASGLMQLMPETAEEYGVSDIYDPKQNVQAGVRYLRDLLALYNNRLNLAVAAYNAGPTAVARYRGIPPYAETRAYVKKVLRYKKQYARASGV